MPKQNNAVQLCKDQFFESAIPTYILDPGYLLLDWNTAFGEILAKPLNLKQGHHIHEFVNQLLNKEEVFERATRVFGVANELPLVDTEFLVIEGTRFGRIQFRKIATQVHNEKGECVAWIVQLNILGVGKPDAFWNAFQEILIKINARNAA